MVGKGAEFEPLAISTDLPPAPIVLKPEEPKLVPNKAYPGRLRG